MSCEGHVCPLIILYHWCCVCVVCASVVCASAVCASVVCASAVCVSVVCASAVCVSVVCASVVCSECVACIYLSLHMLNVVIFHCPLPVIQHRGIQIANGMK